MLRNQFSGNGYGLQLAAGAFGVTRGASRNCCWRLDDHGCKSACGHKRSQWSLYTNSSNVFRFRVTLLVLRRFGPARHSQYPPISETGDRRMQTAYFHSHIFIDVLPWASTSNSKTPATVFNRANF